MTVIDPAKTKRVAILIEQGVEDSEFRVPYTALRKAGAEVVVLGSRLNEEYRGKQDKVSMKADMTTTEARAQDFDAVVIPGGHAPDKMRVNPNTVHFVRDALEQGKLVAAVCHGPQVLIEGDLLEGRNVTGFVAIRKDIKNAGAHCVDEPLVVDSNLITSRRPGDLPIFTTAILTRLGLDIADTTLPAETDMNAGWWKLGQEWDGSSKQEIVDAINTAIAGERYGLEAFEQYANKTSDPELRLTYQEIGVTKQRHLQVLEERLDTLGEKESFQAVASGAFATVKGWLQDASDDLKILRRALGDLQTGVVDLFNLRNKLTDPATTEIFDAIDKEIALQEQHLAAIYHNRLGSEIAQPAKPTTGAAVSG